MCGEINFWGEGRGGGGAYAPFFTDKKGENKGAHRRTHLTPFQNPSPRPPPPFQYPRIHAPAGYSLKLSDAWAQHSTPRPGPKSPWKAPMSGSCAVIHGGEAPDPPPSFRTLV